MVKDKQQIVDKLKLKPFYDPNALHDLKEINALENIIKDLQHNKQMYLKTFVESKVLDINELLTMIPDHKLDQMLINGIQYFDYLNMFDELKNQPHQLIGLPLSIQHMPIYDNWSIPDEELMKINHRKMINNRNVIFNGLKLESFVVVENAIICLPVNKEDFQRCHMQHSFSSKELRTACRYYLPIQTTQNRHLYRYFNINFTFNSTINELTNFNITPDQTNDIDILYSQIYYYKKTK